MGAFEIAAEDHGVVALQEIFVYKHLQNHARILGEADGHVTPDVGMMAEDLEDDVGTVDLKQ